MKEKNKSTFEIYDDLTIKDIQDAADMFRTIYLETNRLDGYVSLEVNPKLAYNVDETVEEAQRLYKKVNRPNVMFKVPSTEQGFAAVEELIAEGININVTLIFSREQYVKTAQAYVRGIERRLARNNDVSRICSVASVFVSRIDTLTDRLLGEKLSHEYDTVTKQKLEALRGKTAAANSALIYKLYTDTFWSEAFKPLQNKGAIVQRLLWGSTSTKNPAYSDTKYVSELIAKNTINTIPEETFDAFLDHGVVREALTDDIQRAHAIIDDLLSCGIRIDEVCKTLLQDGVSAFEKSFDSLLHSIEEKARSV